MKVLVACEFSGIVREAFAARGHEAMSCDLLPTEISGWHHQGDVRDVLDDDWDLMVAHPPCTRLSNSGVQWLRKPPKGRTLVEMWRELFEGAGFYRLFRHAVIPRIAIENPVMHCHARELCGHGPRQMVQPWWFGDPQFKATGFELMGLPDLVPTNILTPPRKGTAEHKQWSKVHR